MESQDAWKSWSQARVEERSPLASPGMMSVRWCKQSDVEDKDVEEVASKGWPEVRCSEGKI